MDTGGAHDGLACSVRCMDRFCSRSYSFIKQNLSKNPGHAQDDDNEGGDDDADDHHGGGGGDDDDDDNDDDTTSRQGYILRDLNCGTGCKVG